MKATGCRPLPTGMAVFENCSVFLELRNLPFKERRRLKAAVTEHGGDVSFLINKQVKGCDYCTCGPDCLFQSQCSYS